MGICFAALLTASRPAAGQTYSDNFGEVLESEIPLTIVGEPQGVRDRVRPELQPVPWHAGGALLDMEVDTSLGTTSNVLGVQSDRREDGFAEFFPQLLATFNPAPAGQLQVKLDYDGKRYFDTPAKRQDGYTAALTGNYDIDPRGTLFAGVFHQRLYEDQLAGSFPAQGGGAVAIDQTHGAGRIAQSFNRLTLTGAVVYDMLDYQATVTTTGTVLPQSYRNDEVLRAALRADVLLHRDTTLFVQAGWRATDYAHSLAFADHTSRQWRAIGGVAADVSGLIRLSAGIGAYRRRYDALSYEPRFGSIAGLAWDVRGAWYATPLTTLSVQARRDAVDSDIAPSPDYDATVLRAQIDHEFLRNLLLSASIGSEADRFARLARRDHLADYAIWADYWLSRRIVARPTIEYLDRSSQGSAAGAQIRELRTRLTLSYRP